jgi:hypothetical protein
MALNAADAAPAQNFGAVTPSDSTTFTNRPRAIYVGVTGDLVVQDESNVSITFKAVPGGTVLPIRPLRVMAATTASQIVALY